MSLSTRISLMVVAILGASGAVAGIAFYELVHRGLTNEIEGRLTARLAWLEGAIHVDLDGVKRTISLEERGEPSGAAASWRVETADGAPLWHAAAQRNRDQGLRRERTLAFGSEIRQALTGAEIVARLDPGKRQDRWIDIATLSPATLDAVRAAVPGIEIVHADRRNRRDEEGLPQTIIAVEGRTGGRTCRVDVENERDVIRVKDEGFVEYDIARKQGRLILNIEASEPTVAMRAELARLARSLWTIGPGVLLLTSFLLWLLIRWQLDPLRRMASEAARIGPAKTDVTISDAGSAIEYARLRESINGMIARLAEGIERERRFASMAAHELRTPVAQLRTAVEVALRRDRPVAEYQETLRDALDDVGRLEKLIASLLQLARFEGGEAPSLEPVALIDVVNRAIESTTKAGDVEADWDALEGAPMVQGDADLIATALANVLSNALRYAPDTPPQIIVDHRGDALTLTVADRGPGIPEEAREKIFQPLVRLDQSRTIDSAEGFGLGLSIARSAMRAMGGDLICQARGDGQSGALFVFTFRALEGSNLQLSRV